MRAYFAGSSVPTPEEMGKALAVTPEQERAARRLKTLAVAGKKPLRKKSAPAGLLPSSPTKKQP